MLFDVAGCSHKMISNTELLLKSIAWHLSSKRDCRGKTYKVIIDNNTVYFDISITLQSHSGGRNCMMPVIQHIIIEHFSDIADKNPVVNNHCNVIPDSLVPGTYEYRPFASGKYRHWFKV